LMGSKPSALAKDNPNYHVPNSLIRDVWRVHSYLKEAQILLSMDNNSICTCSRDSNSYKLCDKSIKIDWYQKFLLM
jgi:hypothetical protein